MKNVIRKVLGTLCILVGITSYANNIEEASYAKGTATIYGFFKTDAPFSPPWGQFNKAIVLFNGNCDYVSYSELGGPDMQITLQWQKIRPEIYGIKPDYNKRIATVYTKTEHFLHRGVTVRMQSDRSNKSVDSYQIASGPGYHPDTSDVGFYTIYNVPTKDSFQIDIGYLQTLEVDEIDIVESGGTFWTNYTIANFEAKNTGTACNLAYEKPLHEEYPGMNGGMSIKETRVNWNGITGGTN